MFNPIVAKKIQNKYFTGFHSHRVYEPGRQMISNIFNKMGDQDGNFIKDFQSGGFSGRLLELFLFKFFEEQGVTINNIEDRPDFNLEKNGVNFFVEASTSNMTANEVEFTDENISAALRNNNLTVQKRSLEQYVIKIGSVLFSKLQKKYWELPWVNGKPLVIAVAAQHHTLASFIPHAKMFEYLYGTQMKVRTTKYDKLVGDLKTLTVHKFDKKEIPAGFFKQPSAENVSAVIFINSSDFWKFNRMGFEAGIATEDIRMIRGGKSYDSTPGSKAKSFNYVVGKNDTDETWSEGVTVFHNPNAIHPLNTDVFSGVNQTWLSNTGSIEGIMPPLYPYTSLTNIYDLMSFKKLHPGIAEKDIDFAHAKAVMKQLLNAE
jgi:hypothetical protein